MALPASSGRRTRIRLGEALVAAGLITQDQLREAIARQQASEKRLGQVLVEMRLVTERDVTEVLSRQLGVPYLDLSNFLVDPMLVELIPEHIARRHQLVPVNKVGRRLTVAMTDPLDILAVDEISMMTGLQVKTVVATPGDVNRVMEEAFGKLREVDDIYMKLQPEEEAEASLEDIDDGDLVDEQSAPIIRLVNLILHQAVEAGVSDVHVEPFEKELRVRYRADGVLYTAMSPPRRAQAAITSRLKIMAELDIAEKRLPQDGRIKLKVSGRNVDLRVSTLPTVWGEKVVMRILDQSGLNVDLEKLGMEPSTLRRFQEGIAHPYGIVLVTGPTGSGKTTTLYSALTALNQPDVNVMTAEDPVEYQLTGINQCHAKPEIGLTFPAILKSFLRQDPDVIMVGEIRDLETGSIAIKASLTGHLVLSTLHTNDAPSTIHRLVDMGIEPFMITSSVVLVQAQRLVRTLCKDCRMEYRPRPEVVQNLGLDGELLRRIELPALDPRDLKLFRGKGCESCNGSGYKGRTGIYEVLTMSETLRQTVIRGGSVSDIARVARQEGMLSLRESALRKALLGLTSVEEVVRVTAA